MLLTEPLLSCPCCVFGGDCHAGRPSQDPSSMLLLREGGCWPKSHDAWPHPSSPQYGAVVLSTLQEKALPKHDVSTPMLQGWDGVLGIVLILLPPNMACGVYTKKLYFGLIWLHDLLPCLLWIIQMVFGKLQTGLDMCWLEQGDLARAAGF